MSDASEKYHFYETDPDKSNRSSEPINYSDTLRMWKEKGSRLVFIYDIVLEKYKWRIGMFNLIALLLTSATSLTALSNLGLSESSYPNIALAFKITSAVLTTSAALVTSFNRIFDWTSLVDNCQKYLDTVEHFTASIISEQMLPEEYKGDPEQFIIQHRDQFLSILNSAPDISHSDYQSASGKYEASKIRFRQELINILIC